jgi:hypothetical protein
MRGLGLRGLVMMIAALFAGTAAAGVKYVAVVETDVDASLGASDELKPAEAREITAELRRQAAKNLPRDKYNVMTSETVQSMGGAVLEECADENCVITLGSKIGADYIVRGTVSKFQTKFTLAIELHETETGTLVASSEAVRSGNLEELLGMAKAASAEMYREFAGVKETAQVSKAVASESAEAKEPTQELKVNAEPKEVAKKSEIVTINGRKYDYYIAPKYQFGRHIPWGGVNLEGGVIWGKGAFAGLDLGIGYWWENDDYNAEAGISINIGNTYSFGNRLQLAYGGWAGIWYMADYISHDVSYGYSDINKYYYRYIGPFVKLRRNFVELTYRGLLGFYDDSYFDNSTSSSTSDKTKKKGISSWTHQLMLGFYFATDKQTR